MTKNTKQSLWFIGAGLLSLYGPVIIVSILWFAIVASIVGESRLEDPVTGASTPLGLAVTYLPFLIVGFFILLGVVSIIAEFATKGKRRLVLSAIAWYEKQRAPWPSIAFVVGILMVILALVPLSPEEPIGANIGGGILLSIGAPLALLGLILHVKDSQKNKKKH